MNNYVVAVVCFAGFMLYRKFGKKLFKKDLTPTPAPAPATPAPATPIYYPIYPTSPANAYNPAPATPAPATQPLKCAVSIWGTKTYKFDENEFFCDCKNLDNTIRECIDVDNSALVGLATVSDFKVWCSDGYLFITLVYTPAQ